MSNYEQRQERRITESPRANQPKRRTFTTQYKLKMVAEYDAMTEFGARGALLRREGLYQSHIEKWRAAREDGRLTRQKVSASSQNTSAKPSVTSPTKSAPSPGETTSNSPSNSTSLDPSDSDSAAKADSPAEIHSIASLRRKNAALVAELEKTKAVLEIVGKAHDLLQLLCEKPVTSPP